MLNRLKRFQYRRRFGREAGDHVFDIQSRLLALKAGDISPLRAEWIWTQPPAQWAEIVEVWERGEVHAREVGPGGILNPDRLAEDLEAQTDNFHGISKKTSQVIENLQEGARTIKEKPDPRTEATLSRAAKVVEERQPEKFQLDNHLTAYHYLLDGWCEALPTETQEEGREISVLLRRINDARNKLVTAVYETELEIRDPLEPAVSDLRQWLIELDTEYQQKAVPFFERYGRPTDEPA